MQPTTSVESLPGVGSFYSHRLKKLDIETVRDLIYHFPFRYEDLSEVREIGEIREIRENEKTTIQGTVWQIKNVRTRYGKFITNATIADSSGTIEVIWFNQPYLTKTIKAGSPISLSGKIQQEGNRFKMLSPQYELIRSTQGSTLQEQPQGGTLHTGRIVAVYPETEGLTSKWFRAKLALVLPQMLEKFEDYLPEEIIKSNHFIPLNSALLKIHQPEDWQEIETARKRLGFDELFIIQLLTLMRQNLKKQAQRSPKLKIDKEKLATLIKSLPYELTNAQKRAVREILADLTRDIPMNRLLEGDVGSGKTVVAATAALTSHFNGFDTLLAAPTEILAFQHQKTLEEILSPLGIKVGIWTGSKKSKGDITVGTHALLSTFKPEKEIGLVVVDEQHRFGVAQRAKMFLAQNSSLTPHLLTMTATPIPRTLALTLYGDLDLSVLDEMPKGRQKIATFAVPNWKRNDAYKFIEKQIKEGRQAFILTPFVEPSETMQTVKAAVEEFEKLNKIFSSLANTPGLLAHTPGVSSKHTPGVCLGLLHGRLKSKEKEKVINDFKKNKINILVTTPVVEVGIDVPNATVMMIESAERFGLAQLHQLRGRVGRGEHKSYCLLFTDSRSEMSLKRLKSMEKIHVGFELAEIDLKMRGPGEVFGLRQSGFFNFKIADITDHQLVSLAQAEAKKLIEKDPSLKSFPKLLTELNSQDREYSQPN